MFYHLIEGIFFLKAFFLRQLLYKFLEDVCSWVGHGIDRMPHTIDQSFLVKCFLVQQIAQVLSYGILILPVGKFLLHVLKHLRHLYVGSAVLWPFQGSHRRYDRGICIRTG